MDYRNNVFTFGTAKDANHFVNYVYKILGRFESVTLADLYDYAYHEPYDFTANRVVWTDETLNSKEGAIYPMYDSYKDWWFVKFPEPDQYPASSKVSYKDYRRATTPHSIVYTKQTPTPEPLNITILMDPGKDPYTTIREVIRQANEIKDRPVFITIN